MSSTGSFRVNAAADAAPESEQVEPLALPVADARPRATSGWDERAAFEAAKLDLHTDVLSTGVDRLGGFALASALVLGGYLAVSLVLLPSTGVSWTGLAGGAVVPLGLGVVASAVMFGLCRVRGLRPQVSYELGHVFLVGLCLSLGFVRHGESIAAGAFVRQVSPVVLPILAFGALIPAPPKRALIISLVAAAMDPLAFLLGRRGTEASLPSEVIFLISSPLVAALVAYRISLLVHRLSVGVAKAREVGAYRLVERLGVGLMAEVWRAQHQMLARPAAIKLIRRSVLDAHGAQETERLLRLFTREARATASLSSPHTIQVYDFGITRAGAFYYVMELLHGLDLKSLVERFGPQPAERVAYLLAQACHSLGEAHEQAFVHRDVKPANIYACHLGGDHDFVKVLDFGLVLDRHPTAAELEDEQRVVGTPAVMAPEMVRFQAPIDARADIYALGCVGYWLLTGARVFDAATRQDVLVMHAHQKPITPSKRLGSELHPELEALIMLCLEKNPNRRPQSMREVSEALVALEFAIPWSTERSKLWWKKNYTPQPSGPSSAVELTG
jgi:eukaryotic-like serine/threonine-protein kinase